MKIKVCHFVNIITGKSDGIYAHLKMIFKYVDFNKYEHYLVFQGNPKIEEDITRLGVKVFVIPSLEKKISSKSFTDFYAFVKKQNIDIIQAHLIKPYIIGGIVNIILRKKMIFNYHGLFINNLYNTQTEKLLYKIFHVIIFIFRSVDIAIVPSKASKEILSRETKLFPEIITYYNGYDSAINERIDSNLVNYLITKKQTYFIIGVIARLEFEKRIDVALKIAREITLIRNDIFFVFIGDGTLENKMKSFSNSLYLNGNVIFTGYVPNTSAYIKYIDLILFTSDREGMPLTVWESMASGVPLVSTNVGGLKEILEKENCGLIFPRGDIGKGTKCILELLEDENKRIRMGLNGKEAIKNKYNSKNFSVFFNNLYTDILKN